MKTRFVIFMILLFTSNIIFSQPTETVYLGNVIKSGYSDEESFGPIDIGFNFTYFGNTYSQFYVNSNGLVLFGAGSTDGTEDPIPVADEPNNFIAPLWDDLIISSSGKMLYATVGAAPNRKLIIQGTNMGFYPNPIFMGTYLVILYETTNKIQVQYRILIDATSPRAHGESATIGIENSDGTAGVQYSYHNPTAISTGKAISFTPAGSTYTMDTDAIYDGVVLTTNLTLPEPGIPTLLSPPQDAVIGSDYTFEWSESGNSASYTLLISPFSDMGGATSYNTGSSLSYSVTGLTLDATYYWGVFATNATGTTWCEINRFTTSSLPPLAAVAQTIWVEHTQEKTIKLNYTGGDAGAKTAIVTSLPSQGQLFQYNAGVKGAQITSVPATVSDAGRNVIYVANGTTGNGAGNFTFRVNDGTGNSPIAQITVNVSPPGIPNLLYIAKSAGIEMQFDKIMANPAGKQSQFLVTVNSASVAIVSLTLKDGDPYSIFATLAIPLTGSETVTITYTAGTIESAQGGWLASFDEQIVTLLAQTITFITELNKINGDPPFGISASVTSGLPMTYASSNLSVATISGNVVTILAVGSSEITARQAGNAIYSPARYIKILTVSASTLKTLNLTSLFMQGLYNGASTMRQAYDGLGPHWPAGVADHVTVELHNAASYPTIVYTASDVILSTTGTATLTIPSAYAGSYYITIRHRNHIETTTSAPVSFSAATTSYAFDLQSKAYGNNLKLIGGIYAIYGGDSNSDGAADALDLINVENGALSFSSGYVNTDLNGDGVVDALDLIMAENNAFSFVSIVLP